MPPVRTVPRRRNLDAKKSTPTIVSLGCIVEGDGEKRAAPKLLARIASQFRPELQLRFPEPFRVGRNKLVKPGELERTMELIVRRLTA